MKKLLVATSVLALLFREFIKEKKKLVEEPKEDKPKVSENALTEMNLIESLFRGLYFGKELDFSIETMEENDSFLHVSQDDKNLKFLFEIPEIKSGYDNLQIGDYIRGFNKAAEHVEKEIVKFTSKPAKRLIGIVSFTYELSDNESKTVVTILNKDCYEDFAEEEGRDGLSNFYKAISNSDGIPEELSKLIQENYLNGKDVTKFKVNYITLGYEVAFPLRNKTGIGIGTEQAINALFYLSNIEITKRDSSVSYGTILFHPEEDSFADIYDVKDGKVIICSPFV